MDFLAYTAPSAPKLQQLLLRLWSCCVARARVRHSRLNRRHLSPRATLWSSRSSAWRRQRVLLPAVVGNTATRSVTKKPASSTFIHSRQVSQSALTNASAGGILRPQYILKLVAFERQVLQTAEPVCARLVWRRAFQKLPDLPVSERPVLIYGILLVRRTHEQAQRGLFSLVHSVGVATLWLPHSSVVALAFT